MQRGSALQLIVMLNELATQDVWSMDTPHIEHTTLDASSANLA